MEAVSTEGAGASWTPLCYTRHIQRAVPARLNTTAAFVTGAAYPDPEWIQSAQYVAGQTQRANVRTMDHKALSRGQEQHYADRCSAERNGCDSSGTRFRAKDSQQQRG